MRITLKQLEVFVAIAKTNNMAKAAELLYLTQSACSMALTNIEEQLGGLLFDRHGKKLILNDRGRILFPKASNLIVQAKELQELMSGTKRNDLAGHLMVGASTTIGNYLLPKVIGNFMEKYPLTKVTLKINNTEQIIQRVLNFEIDIGFIEGHCYANEIDVLPWLNDELIIIAPPKHPLSKKKTVTLQELRELKWILRESGSGTREIFEEATENLIKPFFELGNTEAIKQGVQAGLGVSCLSKVAVNESVKSGNLVELKAPTLKLSRQFYVILHKNKYKTDLLRRFSQFNNLPN